MSQEVQDTDVAQNDDSDKINVEKTEKSDNENKDDSAVDRTFSVSQRSMADTSYMDTLSMASTLDINFGREIDDENIAYDEELDSYGKRQVGTATLEKILEKTLELNMPFLTVFLDTFPLFYSSVEYLDYLIDKFEANICVDSSTLLPNTNALNEISLASSDEKANTSKSLISRKKAKASIHNNKDLQNSNMGTLAKSNPNLSKKNKEERSYSSKSEYIPTIEEEKDGSNNKSNLEVMSLSLRKSAASINTNPSIGAESKTKSITSSRSIVLKVLRVWISSYYQDFSNNNKLLEKVTKFLEETIATLDKADSLWHQVNVVIVTLAEMEKSVVTMKNEDIKDYDVEVDTLKHADVALALTAVEASLLQKLDLRELLIYSFDNCDNKKEVCSSVVEMIENSTKLTMLVETQVIKYSSAKIRAAEIETWLTVLKDLNDLKNYSSAIAILGALNSDALDRLEKTKKKLSPKKRKLKNDIEEELGLSSFYDKLRIRLDKNPDENAIPFIGTYLTIFDRLKQGGVKNNEGRIKYKNCRWISRLIQSLKARKNFMLFQEVHESKIVYVKNILGLPSLSEEEVDALSFKHEPS